MSRINTRIQDLTGLDVSTAEELQVANYGVGGQYEPHFDFGRVSPVLSSLFLLHKRCVSLFQVANYGVGGQYEPHFDFARASKELEES